MKKIILYTFTSILAFTFIPNESKAETSPAKTEITSDSAKADIALLNRLSELKAMDKSTLSTDQKKANRKEVRSIDQQLRRDNGAIYISGGALLIIIIILLIILL